MINWLKKILHMNKSFPDIYEQWKGMICNREFCFLCGREVFSQKEKLERQCKYCIARLKKIALQNKQNNR